MTAHPIAESPPASLDEALSLYPFAFPNEELRPLVRALFPLAEVLSLSATCDGAVVGHGLFSMCEVTGVDDRAALLGPLAVHPEHQRARGTTSQSSGQPCCSRHTAGRPAAQAHPPPAPRPRP